MNEDLKITNFEQAVASSPYKGHALMRNIDIEAFPGSMRSKSRFFSMPPFCNTVTFTVNTGTDICTGASTLVTTAESDATTNYNYAAVQFTTTGTLPTGLSLATTYFLIYVTDTTFKVATSLANAIAGTAIDITSTGTGTHTVTSLTMGTINDIKKDTNLGVTYAIDSNGRVWHTRSGAAMQLLTGNTLTAASGNGLAIFRVSDGSATYLFVFRDQVIDVINVTALANLDTPVWTSGWQTLNSSAGSQKRHRTLVGQDNIIYFTDDKYLGSIQEKPGSVFVPGTPATYTYNNQALTLPQNEYAYCLCELNANLLVGGNNFNKIYPWDRFASSFNQPLQVPEKGIFELQNFGNQVIILAGVKGNIYSTQGTYVKIFQKIPTYISNNSNTLVTNPVQWGGIAARAGSVIFGAAFAATPSADGLYVLFEDGRFLQENTPYSGAKNVTAIYSENELGGTIIGSNGGLDYLSSTKPSTGSYSSVYQSGLYRIGNKTQKGKFSEIEVQQGRSQGGNIRIGYRQDISQAFTTIATFTSSEQSYSGEIGLIDLENIQIQVEFDDDVEITEVTLVK